MRPTATMTRLALLAALLLGACAAPVRYERPAVELPEAWKQSAPRFAEEGRWWRVYEDAALNDLIEESFETNADLLVAAARVDEARGILGEARSFLWPTLDAQGSAGRQ